MDLDEMLDRFTDEQREAIQKETDGLIGEEIYKREFGWTAEHYALDKKLWPETYVCPGCGQEMTLTVSGTHEDQKMTFTCACGYVKERKP